VRTSHRGQPRAKNALIRQGQEHYAAILAQRIAAAIRASAPPHGPVCHSLTGCPECARSLQAERDAELVLKMGGAA
jgi:hypothetical protein